MPAVTFLYRAFRTIKGPTLDFVIRALDALGFQFVVQVDASIQRDLQSVAANLRADLIIRLALSEASQQLFFART